ncbi:glutathione peroxidase [Lentibacillus sp. CBA3610]|uniref:glutathione peroxidase n=1 Tax=Lentibacillus sp. CBA3610 TaxID=2518176 RepID=UPI0015957553|nr:glutathione peroxidase [Lentibacillus sp. CBA3610]QKY71787.1 glutathione peroxidase [Lentibacillus sp. CBA3610]
MSVYEFSAKTMDREEKSLADYKGQVLLIVNTASECGFTPQFDGLQKLYDTYKDEGLVILGFPCNQFNSQDPGDDADILDFCQSNYGVTFPMFSKIDVKGEHAHPLFVYLTQQAKGMMTRQIKWNFTKFLINRNGDVISRYAPQTKPETLQQDIEEALQS